MTEQDVIRYISSIFWSSNHLDDLIGIALLTYVEYRDVDHPEVSRYLRAKIRGRALNYLRHERKMVYLDDVRSTSRKSMQEYYDILECLSEDDRELVNELILARRTMAEIGDNRGWSKSTVSRNWDRIRRTLRGALVL